MNEERLLQLMRDFKVPPAMAKLYREFFDQLYNEGYAKGYQTAFFTGVEQTNLAYENNKQVEVRPNA